MIELSRTQDEECGDGTTSIIILGAQSSVLSFLFLTHLPLSLSVPLSAFLPPSPLSHYTTQPARSPPNPCPSSSGTSTPSSSSPPTIKPSPRRSSSSSASPFPRSSAVQGVETWPYRAVSDAMEVIPSDLSQDSSGNVIRVLTELRAKCANGEHLRGVNGDTDKIVDMKEYRLYESASVEVLRSPRLLVRTARIILRIDDVVQAVHNEQEGGARSAGGPPEEMMEAQ
ncbi:hypothetical protein CVT25_005306 [Psilocybe cyanescens]|uniref:Uncharacterized protein n=1 Tax=Psilocybe cyanescens TaxID=93625 RepID=A0A409XRZ7_PSICY|nr:hypothetical protein CVT25_005306 [Psilocybe cyanescens]